MEITQVLPLSVEIFAADDFFFVRFVFLTFIISKGRGEKKKNPFLLEVANSRL